MFLSDSLRLFVAVSVCQSPHITFNNLTLGNLTWRVDEFLVDREEGRLGRLASLGQSIHLSLERLQQRRHYLPDILFKCNTPNAVTRQQSERTLEPKNRLNYSDLLTQMIERSKFGEQTDKQTQTDRRRHK